LVVRKTNVDNKWWLVRESRACLLKSGDATFLLDGKMLCEQFNDDGVSAWVPLGSYHWLLLPFLLQQKTFAST
jgi:hypothetical protein